MPGTPIALARAAMPCPPVKGACSRGRRPSVVFAHEQDRQLVDAGPIQGFEKRTAVCGAISEESRRQCRVCPEPSGHERRRRQLAVLRRPHRWAPSMPTEKSGDVHRATFAAVRAVAAAEEFRHHATHVGALCERVAVAAMTARQQVVEARCAHTPAAIASCPIETCNGPRTLVRGSNGWPSAATPPMLISSAASSKARMRAMVR